MSDIPSTETLTNIVAKAVSLMPRDKVSYGATGKQMTLIKLPDGSCAQGVADVFGGIHAQIAADAHDLLVSILNALQAIGVTETGEGATLATLHADNILSQGANGDLLTALKQLHADLLNDNSGLATLHADLGTTTHNDLLGVKSSVDGSSTLAHADSGLLLAQLQRMNVGGSPFSQSATTATTTTLFQAGANGSVIGTLAGYSPGFVSGVLSGTPLVQVFYTASASGTISSVGANAPVMIASTPLTIGAQALPLLQSPVTVPSNMYVRFANSIGQATMFGNRKDL